MKTKTELATRALAILQKLEAGQSPAPEDIAAVEVVIDPLAAFLAQDGVIYISDTDQIDDAAFLPLARRLALEVAPDFGLPAVDEATIAAADLPLRRLAAAKASGLPARVEYF